MFSLRSLSSASAIGCAVLVAAPLFAQGANPLPATLVPAGNPATAQHHVYHASTGTLTTVDAGAHGGALAATATCFTHLGFTAASLIAQDEELVDWGIKSCGLTGLVTEFTMAYQANALDPSMGGPGANFSLALYEGTTGFGVIGTEARRFTFSGLPGAPNPSFPGFHTLTVDVSDDPICLPDGPIGWGFQSGDGMTAVQLAFAPQPALGILDALDYYRPGPAPTGVYTGTFNFGAGTQIATLAIEIKEDDGSLLAGSTVVNGTGVNPLAFSEVSPAVLGQDWVTSLDLSFSSQVNATVVIVTTQAIAPTPTPFGELFVDLTVPTIVTSIALGQHFIPVPQDLALAGTTLHTQATFVEQLVLPVNFTFTNGIDITLGF